MTSNQRIEGTVTARANDMLLRANDLIERHGRYLAARNGGHPVDDAREDINARLDGLLGDLLDNYPDLPHVEEAKTAMSIGISGEHLTDLPLETFPPRAFPIVLVRELFFNQRLSFNHNRVKNLPVFIRRYSGVVAAATVSM